MKAIFGAILCTILFVACGDSSDSSESKNAVDSAIQDSKIQADSAQDSKDSAIQDSAIQTDSAQDSAQKPQKSAQDLFKKCIACHGEKGDKVAPGSAGSVFIADLSKGDLIAAMKGYRAKTLNKGGTAAIMYLQANGLSDADIELLADHIANLKR